jgi:thioredoxin 1
MPDHALITATDETLPALIQREDRLVVVDFWAHWCPPCTTLSRVLADLAEELGDRIAFAQVNVDDNPQSTLTYRIMSMPTVIVFHRGVIVDAFVGARPKAAVRRLLLDRVEPAGVPT